MKGFDVAVVGLGLIGAAALRHLSAGGASVVGVGPDEPADWTSHAGPFASHYDSGRITRRLDARDEWAELAVRSIAEYPKLEEAAGLRFHHPVGMVFVRRDAEGIANQRAVIDRLDLPVTIGPVGEVPTGDYVLPEGWTVLSEPDPAGFVDPRAMRHAQLVVAGRDGATRHDTWVTGVEPAEGGYRIDCHDGASLLAERVLVATGPYLNDLLPVGLAASVVPEAVVLGRVPAPEAERLAGLPSMIYLPDHPLHDDVYVVPPTRYPDGAHYIKIGGSIAGVEALETADEKRKWMSGQAARMQLDSLGDVLRTVLPGVEFEHFSAKPCLITDTAHGLPYIDEVDDGMFVAVGGSGHAAKSSDALGALAAGLVETGRWADGALERSAFAAVTGTFQPDEGSRHGN